MSTTARGAREGLRVAFGRFNRAMVPMLRSPVGPWVSSPVVGYLAVLTTTGRRTGQERRTPLNYAILDGSVYLLAGFGARTDWLANLRDHPQVTLQLPGRTITGLAEVVEDEDEALRGAVAVARNAGFATLFEGVNPVRLSDERLREHLAGRPVVRIIALPTRRQDGGDVDIVVSPTGHDPGGGLWVLPHIVAPIAGYAAWRLVRRALRS